MKAFVVICSVCAAATTAIASLETWTETSYPDFADGWNEHNLWITKRTTSADPVAGSIEFVSRFDYNNDGYVDVIVSTRPMTDRRETMWLYWGSASGYSLTNRTGYPTMDGAEVEGCDLNTDGYPDLAICHYQGPTSSTSNRQGAITLHYGTAAGPDTMYSALLPAAWQTEALYVADLNRDGILDIISGGWVIDNTTPANCRWNIYWGTPTGYSDANSTILRAETPRHNFEVADLNRDGFYDIVVVNYGALDNAAPLHEVYNYVYWGDSTGDYSDSRRTSLKFWGPYPHGSTVADFDNNGWLDICFTGMGRVNFADIYYNGPAGINPTPVRLNSDVAFGGSSAADFDGDGWLDLLFFGGDADMSQWHGKPWIYWGSSTGFSDDRRMGLGIRDFALAGGLVADFNGDTHLDVYVDNWDLINQCGVLWGPDWRNITEVPANRDHHSVFKEIGDPYTRAYQEYYTSSVYDAGTVVNWDVVTWIDSTTAGDSILAAVRTGNTPTPDASWSPWTPFAAYGTGISDSLNSQYIQYKLALCFTTPAYFPFVYQVQISYNPGITIEPDRRDSTYRGRTKNYVETLTNDGGGFDVIDLTTRSTQTTWRVELFDSTGATRLGDRDRDSIPDAGAVPPYGGTTNFVVKVTPPFNAVAGETDTTVVYARSTNNFTIADSAVLITRVIPEPAIVVTPDQVDSTFSGIPIRYTLNVLNNGNGTDVIGLTATHSRPTWQLVLYDSTGTDTLRDSNANDTVDVGGLPGYGGRARIIVELTPPPTAAAGELDTTIVTGWSSVQANLSSAATLLTKIRLWASVLVEPDSSSIATPGVTVRYPLDVSNNSSSFDVIDVVATTSQPSWNLSLSRDSLGSQPLTDTDGDGTIDVGRLNPFGGQARIWARLTPPAGTIAGTVDNTIVRGISSNDTTAYDDARLVTTVGLFARIDLEPSQTDTISRPDSVAVYEVKAVSFGNGTEYIDLAVTTQETRWRTALLDSTGGAPLLDHDGDGIPDVGPLKPNGDSTHFHVQVVAPTRLGYIVGPIDRANAAHSLVRGTSSLDSTVRDSVALTTVLIPPLDVHNFPNPFGARTTFVFSLPDDGRVTLRITNRAGEHIKTLLTDAPRAAGIYDVDVWDGTNERGQAIAPGVYIYRFEFRGQRVYPQGRSIYKKAVRAW